MKTTLFLLVIATATTLCLPASGCAEEQQDANAKIPLPGLAVSLGMSVDEVASELRHFKFRHIPEKRWQKNGNSFVSAELIVCSAVSLQELNEQLVEARFVFDQHSLVQVELTVLRLHKPLEPLVETLKQGWTDQVHGSRSHLRSGGQLVCHAWCRRNRHGHP